MSAALKLFEEFGIELVSAKAYRRIGKPMTFCRSTVERLIKARGVEHARMVLMLITQTEGNCDQLSGPALWGGE